MVNRVVLCGILTEKPRESDTHAKGVTVTLKCTKYGTYYTTIRGMAWRNSAKWVLEKDLQAGDAVQIVGSLASGREGLGLSVDSLQKIEWLTEAHKKHPWPEEDYKQATKQKQSGENPVR